jgi:cytochrome P450
LLGYLAAGQIDGAAIPYEQIQAITFNLMVGGVDTTTALTSNVLLHLSRNPEHRRRLIEEPALRPYAREEFIRYVSPIHGLARNAKQDVEVDGWRFAKGDRVLLAYASANRDPDVFDNPEEVVLDRFPNRHIGFGAGMHRCIGSFLARMMFEVMLDEVLRRMPDFRVREDGLRCYPSVGKVNGWISMPAVFPPGPKVGAKII